MSRNWLNEILSSTVKEFEATEAMTYLSGKSDDIYGQELITNLVRYVSQTYGEDYRDWRKSRNTD